MKESRKGRRSVWQQVVGVTNINICENVKKIIKEKFTEYYCTFENCMKSSRHFNCNMFIAKKEIIDKYCEWLFSVLAEVEKAYWITEKKIYRNREIGYLGEMLFRVWIEQNEIPYINLGTVNIEDNVYSIFQVKEIIKNIVNRKKYGKKYSRKEK